MNGLIKGYIEVVSSNSVSTSSCDIVVYWGYGQMDPCVVITTSIETYDGLMVIHVVMWVDLSKQRRLYSIFCENMDFDKHDTTVWYRVTRNP